MQTYSFQKGKSERQQYKMFKRISNQKSESQKNEISLNIHEIYKNQSCIMPNISGGGDKKASCIHDSIEAIITSW